MSYTFKENGRTYKTKNALRIMTTTVDDEYFGDIVEIVLWRTKDGLYYFTLEDIVGGGDFTKTVHFWAAELDEVRYWMRKNGIEIYEAEDNYAEGNEDLYNTIMCELFPEDY